MIRRALAAIGLLGCLASGALAAPSELRIGLPSEPTSLDPTASSDAATLRVAFGNIFETLVRLDENGQVQPWLAETWELAPDGLSLTVSVRLDAHFHDGSAFEADDAAFSLNRQMGKRAEFSAISGVSVIDPKTLRIVLSQPDPDLLKMLASPAAVMVAPESAENNASEPIGTGPFALFDWFEGDRLVLERNETYWGEHPKIVKASMVTYADSAMAVRALGMGDVDGLAHVADGTALRELQNFSNVYVTDNGAWKVGIEGVPVDMPEDWLDLTALRWAE